MGFTYMIMETKKFYARPPAHWRPWNAIASLSPTPNASESGKPMVELSAQGKGPGPWESMLPVVESKGQKESLSSRAGKASTVPVFMFCLGSRPN